MDEKFKLAVIFLEHARVRVVVPADAAELEDLLGRVWETGQAAWPSVELPAEFFVRCLAERLSEACVDVPLERVLERLVLPDLCLACACVHKVPEANEALEHHYLK